MREPGLRAPVARVDRGAALQARGGARRRRRARDLRGDGARLVARDRRRSRCVMSQRYFSLLDRDRPGVSSLDGVHRLLRSDAAADLRRVLEGLLSAAERPPAKGSAMSSPEEDRAAELLELLLTDGEFRSSFRRNPAAACEAFDLPDLAREFSAGSGKALHTLEIRESRSSLAGAFMAAASEGGSGVESLRQMHDHGLARRRAPGRAPRADEPEARGGDRPGRGRRRSASPRGLGGHGRRGGSTFTSRPTPSALLPRTRTCSSRPRRTRRWRRGGADHRIVSVLETLSRDHDLQIGTRARDPRRRRRLDRHHVRRRLAGVRSRTSRRATWRTSWPRSTRRCGRRRS